MDETRRAAKPKHGPALFDLLPRERGRRGTTRETPAENPGAMGQPSVDGAGGGTVEGMPQASHGATAERKALFELVGDRVHLSMTSVTGAVLVFALLLLLGAVYTVAYQSGVRVGVKHGYEEGRVAYTADAISEIEQARRQPPATHLISGLLDDAAAATRANGDQAGAAAVTKWIRDHTYIVVQEFLPGRADDALKAQAFLAREAVETEIVQYPSGSIQLITARGYNRDDPTQRQLANQLLEKVHRVGEAYFASRGGYKLEGYFKTLKSDSW